MAFCKNCGQQLADGAKFCGSCGTPVTAAAEPQPQQSAAAPQEHAPEAPVYAAPQEPMQPEPTYAAPQPVSNEAAPPAEQYQPTYQYPQNSYQPQSNYQYPQDGYQPQSNYQYPQDGYQPQSNYQYPQDGYGYGGGGYVPPEQPSKKKSKKGLVIGIIAAAVVVIAAVVLVLLLGGKGSSDFVGYWECAGADLGEGEIVDEIFGTDVKELVSFALKDDGTFTMVSVGEDTVNGTWTSDKKSVTLTYDGDSIVLPYEDDRLVMDFSEFGLDITIYFEYESKKIPADFGYSISDSVGDAPTSEPDTPSISDKDTDKPARADDEPAEVPADELYCSFDGLSYEILGGEPCTGDDGENCFRVYCRFTNDTDTYLTADSHWFTAYQDGEELEYYWLMDASDEDDYYYSNIMPGTSIICSRVYQLNNNSPLDFYISEYWDISDGESYAFCRFDVTADTADGLTNNFPAVSDPTWTDGMTDEVTWDNLYVYIDSAELASSWEGTDDLIRVYFDWINYYDNSDGGSSFYMETTLYAFQDGVELNWGSASDSIDSEMDIYGDYAIGDGGTVCRCWELISRSPVVVLVVNWRTGECIGCTFYFN